MVIDQIEELDNDQITVEYESKPTSCKVSIEGIEGEILVSGSVISLAQTQRQPPTRLLESLFQMQTALIDTYNVRLIAFNEPVKS